MKALSGGVIFGMACATVINGCFKWEDDRAHLRTVERLRDSVAVLSQRLEDRPTEIVFVRCRNETLATSEPEG